MQGVALALGCSTTETTMASGGLSRVVVCESNLDVLQTPADVR